MTRRVILVAGPSGSGKSLLARRTGVPQLRLDDFYHDADFPGLPRTLGIVDWDDPRSWRADAAVAALQQLLETGEAEVPSYDISLSRAVGSHLVTLPASKAILAEGIFAPELLAPCREAGLAVCPIWLDRSTAANFSRRLRRDLAEHRKPPVVLVRRGWALARGERSQRADALSRGFQSMGLDQAVSLTARLAGVGS